MWVVGFRVPRPQDAMDMCTNQFLGTRGYSQLLSSRQPQESGQ